MPPQAGTIGACDGMPAARTKRRTLVSFYANTARDFFIMFFADRDTGWAVAFSERRKPKTCVGAFRCVRGYLASASGGVKARPASFYGGVSLSGAPGLEVVIAAVVVECCSVSKRTSIVVRPSRRRANFAEVLSAQQPGTCSEQNKGRISC